MDWTVDWTMDWTGRGVNGCGYHTRPHSTCRDKMDSDCEVVSVSDNDSILVVSDSTQGGSGTNSLYTNQEGVVSIVFKVVTRFTPSADT